VGVTKTADATPRDQNLHPTNYFSCKIIFLAFIPSLSISLVKSSCAIDVLNFLLIIMMFLLSDPFSLDL